MIRVGITYFILCIFSTIDINDAACTLPTELSGDWWDSRVSDTINFNNLRLTGWSITINTQPVTTYTCVESDSTRWVFRSDQTFRFQFGVQDYYAIYCLEYSHLTDNSYSYYVLADIEGNTQSRVSLVDAPTFNTYSSISDYCSPLGGHPDIREYNVLVKNGQHESVHLQQYFPDPLLGVFSYTIDDGSGTTGCSAGSVWDGCYFNGDIDRTVVTLNYSVCNTEIMNSTTGVLYHVANISDSSTNYVTLLTVDGATTYFTCIAVSQTGMTRSISTHPGGCTPTQTSTVRVQCDGCRLLSLTEIETCLFTTTTSTTTTTTTTTPTTSTTVTTTNNATVGAGASSSSDGSNTGAIVGAVLAILLLIAVIIIAYLVYRNYFRGRKKSKIINRQSSRDPGFDIKKGLPPDSDFSLSVRQRQTKNLDLKREPTMSDDLVLDSLSPRDGAVSMDQIMMQRQMSAPRTVNSKSTENLVGNEKEDIDDYTDDKVPIPNHQKAPVNFLFTRNPSTVVPMEIAGSKGDSEALQKNLAPLPNLPRAPTSFMMKSRANPLPPISNQH